MVEGSTMNAENTRISAGKEMPLGISERAIYPRVVEDGRGKYEERQKHAHLGRKEMLLGISERAIYPQVVDDGRGEYEER